MERQRNGERQSYGFALPVWASLPASSADAEMTDVLPGVWSEALLPYIFFAVRLVIGFDNTLTGFAVGLEVKKKLLLLES